MIASTCMEETSAIISTWNRVRTFFENSVNFKKNTKRTKDTRPRYLNK